MIIFLIFLSLVVLGMYLSYNGLIKHDAKIRSVEYIDEEIKSIRKAISTMNDDLPLILCFQARIIYWQKVKKLVLKNKSS